MKPAKLIVGLIFATALVPNWRASATAASAGKQVLAQRGGKAPDHMSQRGSANTNAQWSADPERGWIRADKRHELHEQTGTARDLNRESDKAKKKRKSD
ncbi:MAG TPA: hypothetical protein VF452_00220 [Candidatus Binatia bacterium]